MTPDAARCLVAQRHLHDIGYATHSLHAHRFIASCAERTGFNAAKPGGIVAVKQEATVLTKVAAGRMDKRRAHLRFRSVDEVAGKKRHVKRFIKVQGFDIGKDARYAIWHLG